MNCVHQPGVQAFILLQVGIHPTTAEEFTDLQIAMSGGEGATEYTVLKHAWKLV